MGKIKVIEEAAGLVHEDWCISELKAYFDRAKKLYESGLNPGEALREACYKGEQKRNEVDIDIGYMIGHETDASKCFDDFNSFMKLVKVGAIEVKRFVGRELTSEEIKEDLSTGNYKAITKEENILRPFSELSQDSRKENLEAAIGAYNVFEQLSKAGYSIEDMRNNQELKHRIGVLIHLDWLKRNPDHQNDGLKVPYDKLDEWTKQQDITVFEALLKVVEQKKFIIPAEPGYKLPNMDEILAEEAELCESFSLKRKH